MKRSFTYLLLLAYLGLLTNCAPTLELQSLHPKPSISVEDIKRFSTDSTYVLTGKKYEFPRHVNHVEYRPEWSQLGVQFLSEQRDYAYAVYDLQQEKLNWVNKGNYELSLLQKDISLVRNADKQVLLDAKSGLPLRWVDQQELVAIGDSVILDLRERFARIDPQTGRILWSRNGEKRYEGWLSDALDGDWMYVIANGLHGFNLETGEGWYQAAQTDYDASRGKRAIANSIMVGLNILSIAAGGYGDEFPFFGPQRAHNIHAKPIFDGNDLYFADRKQIYCLHKTTGELFWNQSLADELGVSKLEKLSSSNLLLIGQGYRNVNYGMEKDKVAVLFLCDVEDGQVIIRRELSKGEVINDHAVNDAYLYLLTTDKLYRYDHELRRAQVAQVPSEYGPPMRVISWSSSRYDADLQTDIPDFPLVIRTLYGVVAYHPVTLEELWYQRLGNPVREMPSSVDFQKWQRPLLLKESDSWRSWVDETTETFWFAHANTITGLDLLNDGKKIAEYELDGDNFWYVGDGKLVLFDNRNVQILQLRAISPENGQ